MLLSDGLLISARKRLDQDQPLNEIDLRRCVSDLYYALFHAICETLTSVIQIEDQPSPLPISQEIWLRLYRLPDHGLVARNCEDERISGLPREIWQFANQVKTLKVAREDADYNPQKQFESFTVRKMLELVETALTSFKKADEQHRLRFAILVALKRR